AYGTKFGKNKSPTPRYLMENFRYPNIENPQPMNDLVCSPEFGLTPGPGQILSAPALGTAGECRPVMK
ncbi:hypothetical protein DSO57_1038757, partial [Entomophthora muscae]